MQKLDAVKYIVVCIVSVGKYHLPLHITLTQYIYIYIFCGLY